MATLALGAWCCHLAVACCFTAWVSHGGSGASGWPSWTLRPQGSASGGRRLRSSAAASAPTAGAHAGLGAWLNASSSPEGAR
eukprot:CAMPEP_0177391304 /NCGR_PEP_ID=MMETSP0368-20130122/53697_2 /TAXON_ID=447022 ORGANISM="Scrippsiella hangoei-like, Strain SHHI-4" /NCGR_SAMPLE_ID=MMETSP0368 /ASSEMBLY_ACC=CAM_ASM_000363 /LENGTH=81 /DNA_ID= /DNA_START= /DNA_END= /DNA_ORIENTATION=